MPRPLFLLLLAALASPASVGHADGETRPGAGPPAPSPTPRSWQTSLDFDGDGAADEIEVRFTGGAHCCYALTLALRTGARFTLPFLLDGGYVGGLDLSRPDHFSIGDHDADGRPDLRAWVDTYNGEELPLSRALRRRGVRTHHILVDVVRGRPRYRDWPPRPT